MRGVSRGVVAKVLNYSLEVSEFELQLCYNVHFGTNTLGKSMKPFIHPAMD